MRLLTAARVVGSFTVHPRDAEHVLSHLFVTSAFHVLMNALARAGRSGHVSLSLDRGPPAFVDMMTPRKLETAVASAQGPTRDEGQ